MGGVKAGFLRGTDDDYPILLPVTKPGGNASPAIAFCRNIRPAASILLPDLREYGRASFRHRQNADEIVLDDLSELLRSSVAIFDIALLPIIVVGHGSGADLAAKFALRHNPYLAAAILFRPTSPVMSAPLKSLGDLSVLLVTTIRADTIASPEWKIRNAFSAAGAQVICEYVATGSRRSNRDAALARIFIASQFGLTD